VTASAQDGGRIVAVATHPFGEADDAPRRLLLASGARVHANPHGRRLKPDELRTFLDGACAVVAGTERYDGPLLDAVPDLRLIARVGIGLDTVDLEAARARGVAVSWTPDAPSDSVAELAVGLMISLARHVGRADRAIRAGRWERLTGPLLKARTVGLLGFGRIGRRIARILAPIGCRVLATDIDPLVAAEASRLGVTLVPFAELLGASDLVSAHVPLTPETRRIFDAAAFARLRRGALFVNTSRGELVDEPALLAALESGHLGGASLDVFCEEPYKGPLAAREDVILTAHMGSCSDEGRKAMELGAARAVAAFLTDQPIPDRVV
jgi:D-3-phosphoglycerate dehydrogenase